MLKLDETLALWPLPENWGQVSKFYLEALEDAPVDLVDEALRHARLHSKWLPKPSELRETVESRIRSRARLRQQFEAKPEAPPEAPTITDEQRQADRPKIEEALAEIRATQVESKPVEPYRSDTPSANARRQMLREAFAKWQSGILDGTIETPRG